MSDSESKGLGVNFCYAARKGDFLIARILVEGGVSVNITDEDGNTPLHWAALWGPFEMVKYLVEHGADVNATDEEGGTPFHRAVESGRLYIVRYLVEHGADVNATDKECWTALHWAARAGNLNIVKYLVEEHGAKVNATTKGGLTPLHWAARSGFSNTMKYLVEHGADMNKKDEYGKTPLDFEKHEEVEDTVRLYSAVFDRSINELRDLIREFENFPRERETGGKFIVDKNIWDVNRELAILNLREVIRLFRRYPKLIDWSGKYCGTFTFGGRLSNDDPGNEGTIACASVRGDFIKLGSHFFSLSLEEFKRMCQQNQKEYLCEDGVKRNWHVRADKWELQTVRHEFGHVFQFLFKYVMTKKNGAWRDESEYCRKFKEFIIVNARKFGWDESAPKMGKYGRSADWEWFAESFANAQNAFADEPFREDPDLSAEENERQKKMLNEARLVGDVCWHLANDFADDISSFLPIK